jgi:GntR family transcriptional regulator / MocR family aminotransferase
MDTILIWIEINKKIKTSLTRQVYEQLRNRILNGELKARQKLPSTRKLSKEYKISRNIIVEVYEQLTAEGYLDTAKGSGTYVAEGINLNILKRKKFKKNTLMTSVPEFAGKTIYNFITGTPDLKAFPKNLWARYIKSAYLNTNSNVYNYGNECPEFKETLSWFLLKTKGIKCSTEQIFILPGSGSALYLIFKLLSCKNKNVILEDPVFSGIIKICKELNLNIIPFPVDNSGIKTESLYSIEAPSFIHVIPSHQYPAGSVLSIQRRIQLIEYADKKDIFIVENDYDSEFRYFSVPVSSLFLLAPEKVIHTGTFSETMYPSIRTGYMVVPHSLIEKCRSLVNSSMFTASKTIQYALSSFIKSGAYERHVEKMKRLYKKKNDILKDTLKKAFKSDIRISGDSTGLFFTAEFKNTVFTEELMELIYKNNIIIDRVEDNSIVKGNHNNKLIFGFGNIKIENIKEGVSRLKSSIKPN